MKAKLVQVSLEEKKLGRERAYGQAWGIGDDRSTARKIQVDSRQRESTILNTLLHESLHVIFPELPERAVVLAANSLARALWAANYRRKT